MRIPVLPSGFVEPLTINLLTDNGLELLTDSGVPILANTRLEKRYTHPDLHRRINQDAYIPPINPEHPEEGYIFISYDKDGNPYKQFVKVGILDSMHSYRMMETYTHDEESTTCEIP